MMAMMCDADMAKLLVGRGADMNHKRKDGINVFEFGAAMGAARLAMIGATGADPATILTKPETARIVEPDKNLVQAYAEAHDAYRKTYSIIKELP